MGRTIEYVSSSLRRKVEMRHKILIAMFVVLSATGGFYAGLAYVTHNYFCGQPPEGSDIVGMSMRVAP